MRETPAPLRVLLIEDDELDAELIEAELRRAGFAAVVERVWTREGAIAAFDRGGFDVVLSDYRLPGLTAPETLALYKERGRGEPFFVCSGRIDDEQAVELLKGGAADFFRKDVLARLGSAIRRELQDEESRRARQRAEAALSESEERFRRVVESSPSGILLADATGTIVLVNEALESMFGYSREELVGRPVELLVPETARAFHVARREAFSREPAPRRMGGDRQLTGRKRDGTFLPVEVGLSHFVSPSGPMSVASVVDVSRQRLMEAQLRQGQKMEAIGRLAGGVAHDFNNILTAILGFGELAQLDLAPGHPARARVDEILKAAERAAELTRQMLAFSRQQVLRPRPLDLNKVVEGTRAMLDRLIGADVRIEARLDPGARAVLADPTQIEQVLLNLAMNARDAMPDGGVLTIETANALFDEAYVGAHAPAVPGLYVLLAVSDTGAGMDETTRSRVFEPFFTTKPEGKGTGLGLSMVYGIVKQSGGFIWLYTEPGQGTAFKVYLPAVDRPEAPDAGRESPADSPAGAATVLLVEDQPGVRALTRELLERNGYTVLEAPDGAGRHGGPIDLLVTDVVMPGMGGRELAQRLRALRPETRVLFMSGYSSGAFASRGTLASDVELLEKPFTAQALLLAVRKALVGRGA